MKYLAGFATLILSALHVTVTATAPEPVRFVNVTTGADHVCALTGGGEAHCWGSNEFGQLGIGSADVIPHPAPVRVSGNTKFTTLVAGFTHTCGIARDGAAFCWGANDNAQLGDGTSKASPTPVRVAGDLRFRTIGPGGTHTCAVSTDGVGYCWGGNWHGQLGVGHHDGDPPEHLRLQLPTAIQTELRFRTVVAGGISSCGIALDGKAYCWGSPQEGRLGTGAADAANKFADKMVPTAVAGDVVFATVTPGMRAVSRRQTRRSAGEVARVAFSGRAPGTRSIHRFLFAWQPRPTLARSFPASFTIARSRATVSRTVGAKTPMANLATGQRTTPLLLNGSRRIAGSLRWPSAGIW
jgi:hypothetical protein